MSTDTTIQIADAAVLWFFAVIGCVSGAIVVIATLVGRPREVRGILQDGPLVITMCTTVGFAFMTASDACETLNATRPTAMSLTSTGYKVESDNHQGVLSLLALMFTVFGAVALSSAFANIADRVPGVKRGSLLSRALIITPKILLPFAVVAFAVALPLFVLTYRLTSYVLVLLVGATCAIYFLAAHQRILHLMHESASLAARAGGEVQAGDGSSATRGSTAIYQAYRAVLRVVIRGSCAGAVVILSAVLQGAATFSRSSLVSVGRGGGGAFRLDVLGAILYFWGLQATLLVLQRYGATRCSGYRRLVGEPSAVGTSSHPSAPGSAALAPTTMNSSTTPGGVGR